MDSSQLPKQKKRVARFDVFEATEGDTESVLSFQVPLLSDTEFDLGRGDSAWRSNVTDPSVSNRHARIRCLLFETDETSLPPLVYVTDRSCNGTFVKRASSDDFRRIYPEDGPVLLDDADSIRLGANILCMLRIEFPKRRDLYDLTEAQSAEAQLFGDRYIITRQVLGTGGQATVYAARHVTTNKQLACKVISLHASQSYPGFRDNTVLRKQTVGKMAKRVREFGILKDIGHVNIMRLEKVFWTSNTIYIFQELFTGGDLFSFLAYRNQQLHEIEITLIAFQILKAMEYLHNQGIVHRDLKLENVLMSSMSPLSRIVVTDFGHASQVTMTESPTTGILRLSRMKTFVGTLDYNAPEVRAMTDSGYTHSVDMWSIGIIVSILLIGSLPLTPDMTLSSFYQDMETGPAWEKVGDLQKDFVLHLLQADDKARMSAKEALLHYWFTNPATEPVLLHLYQQATSGWTRSSRRNDIVEALDTSRVKTSTNKSKFDVRRMRHDVVNKSSNFHLGPSSQMPLDFKELPSSPPLKNRKRATKTYVKDTFDLTESEDESENESNLMVQEVADLSIENTAGVDSGSFGRAYESVHGNGIQSMYADLDALESVPPPPHDEVSASPISSIADDIRTSSPIPERIHINPNQTGLRELRGNARSKPVPRPKKRAPSPSHGFKAVQRDQRSPRKSSFRMGDGFDGEAAPSARHKRPRPDVPQGQGRLNMTAQPLPLAKGLRSPISTSSSAL